MGRWGDLDISEQAWKRTQAKNGSGGHLPGASYDFNNIYVHTEILAARTDRSHGEEVSSGKAACLRAEALSGNCHLAKVGRGKTSSSEPLRKPSFLPVSVLRKCATAFPENLWSIKPTQGKSGFPESHHQCYSSHAYWRND
jgi:hypothetical protein